MSFQVIFTFDIKQPYNKDRQNYDDFRYNLQQIGFSKKARDNDGVYRDLPQNLYLKEISEETTDARKITNDISESVNKILKSLNIKAKYFIFVGKDWSYRVADIK